MTRRFPLEGIGLAALTEKAHDAYRERFAESMPEFAPPPWAEVVGEWRTDWEYGVLRAMTGLTAEEIAERLYDGVLRFERMEPGGESVDAWDDLPIWKREAWMAAARVIHPRDAKDRPA